MNVYEIAMVNTTNEKTTRTAAAAVKNDYAGILQKMEGEVKSLRYIEANNTQEAHQIALVKYANGNDAAFRITRFASLAENTSVFELASDIVRSYARWEMRNEFAVVSMMKRQDADWQEMEADARLAIVEMLTEYGSAATMLAVKRFAFTAIGKGRRQLNRISECLLNPDAPAPVLNQHESAPTNGRLSFLLMEAKDATEISEEQTQILEMHNDGLSFESIGDIIGKNKLTVYRLYNRAAYKVMLTAVKIGGLEAGSAFASYITESGAWEMDESGKISTTAAVHMDAAAFAECMVVCRRHCAYNADAKNYQSIVAADIAAAVNTYKNGDESAAE